MARRQRWWTTVEDVEKYKRITWSFLKNIKMTWEYDGMAHLFRDAGIPICGIDRGTMKMNHPVLTLGIPIQRDKNYGVDIYVPAKMKHIAAKLLADEERVRACAELEAEVSDGFAESFNRAAIENKKRHAAERKERRHSVIRRFAGFAHN